jgi:hypothetical protein
MLCPRCCLPRLPSSSAPALSPPGRTRGTAASPGSDHGQRLRALPVVGSRRRLTPRVTPSRRPGPPRSRVTEVWPGPRSRTFQRSGGATRRGVHDESGSVTVGSKPSGQRRRPRVGARTSSGTPSLVAVVVAGAGAVATPAARGPAERFDSIEDRASVECVHGGHVGHDLVWVHDPGRRCSPGMPSLPRSRHSMLARRSAWARR